MNLEQANHLRRKNLHLIGKSINGERIDDIIIVPSTSENYDLFISEYVETRDWSIIDNYSDDYYDVLVVFEFEAQWRNQNIHYYSHLSTLPKELGVNLVMFAERN